MPQHTTNIQPAPKQATSDHPSRSARRQAAALVFNASASVAAHNGESDAFAGTWPTNFSKGLPHDVHGIVDAQAYSEFFEEIAHPTYTDNSGNRVALFDTPAFHGPFRTKSVSEGSDFKWRAWDSPVCARPFSLKGPDAGAVGIAPAPRLGSDELAAEMAELYAMAYLRDVSFEDMRDGACGADAVSAALSQMTWFRPDAHPLEANGEEIGKVASARRIRDGAALSPRTLFRGSSQGNAQGPYLSQFLLQGLGLSLDGRSPIGAAPLPAALVPTSRIDALGGMMPLAVYRIDPRIKPQTAGVDYLRDWAEWLDVQNGADTQSELDFAPYGPKFIETPRDLASHTRTDMIFQAYLNACMVMLCWGTPTDEGLPDHGRNGPRNPFAAWGGPHILTLLTETAARALRAVRQQTFQVHNRARPEKLGGVASLIANRHGATLGAAETLAEAHLSKLESAACDGFNLMDAIAALPIKKRFAHDANSHRGLPKTERNLLLPMAFPEGSPMHPAYGAGQAAVAGACVTVLKAFFRTHAADGTRLSLDDAGARTVCVPARGGKVLVNATRTGDDITCLTLNGELNKLAANMSLGGSMAGVHYYSDYFDSVRMGERIAVGILAEQVAAYTDTARMTLETFDGDRLSIIGGGKVGSEIHVQNSTPEVWWTRHLPEQAGW